MKTYKKPKKLQPGDVVAVLSPSWCGPSVFPGVYENGLKVLEEWGLKTKEYPMTRAKNDSSLENAKLRAQDINNAFADKEVKAVFVSIGGDDSIRILPFIDTDIIKNNPKVFMGYSDTTTMLAYFNQLGLVTFNGPSVMAGLSQAKNLPKEFIQHVYSMLFVSSSFYEYPTFNTYCDGYLDFSLKQNLGKIKPLSADKGMRTLQGKGVASGQLFGGCMEVLEFLKGTRFYPNEDFWNDKILFLETSEEKPSIASIKYMLRNYGAQGIFDRASGLIFARARNYSEEEKQELDTMIKHVVSVEFDKPNLPIVTNAEFGHTDPQIVLPNGIMIEINLDTPKLRLVENCVK